MWVLVISVFAGFTARLLGSFAVDAYVSSRGYERCEDLSEGGRRLQGHAWVISGRDLCRKGLDLRGSGWTTSGAPMSSGASRCPLANRLPGTVADGAMPVGRQRTGGGDIVTLNGSVHVALAIRCRGSCRRRVSPHDQQRADEGAKAIYAWTPEGTTIRVR